VTISGTEGCEILPELDHRPTYDEAHHDMTKRYLDGAIAHLLPNREIIKMLVS
jgi:hypothetical protein